MMKRSNFVLGLGVSLLGHAALLLWLFAGTAAAPPAPSRPQPTPIQIASVDPAEKLPLDPLAPAPETSSPPAPAHPAPEPLVAPPPTLERVAEPPPARRAEPPPRPRPRDPPAHALARRDPPEPAPTPDAVAAAAPDPFEGLYESVPDDDKPPPMSGRGEGEAVPPLRVHWTDARELVSVARALGMRLAAVDDRGEIIGEIALSDTPGLKPWSGLPYGYSNRVRMLSPSIFSTRLEADIREIWVFVPSDRDRAMVEAQRRAVERAGARLQDVAAVDGRFVRAANGSYRLDITNIRWRNG